jgi:hypothetical protein
MAREFAHAGESKESGQNKGIKVAVQGVSSEPVSADFPDMQGKYREFSRIRPVSALAVPANC